jgi:putative Mg2+ transporter-C (MgtC) family protein
MSDLDVSVVLRLIAAAVAGIALGFPRDASEKPIGMRTLALVSLGAAMMVTATLHYSALAEDANAISRVLQGLVQGLTVGVGFIGAGVILRDTTTNKVHGLTTATSVLIASAIGVACGLAQWTVVVTGLALALSILIVIKQVERRVTRDRDIERH